MTARDTVHDRWDFDVEPALQSIRDHIEYALQTLDDAYTLRSIGYSAETTKVIADYAADLAGTSIDLLSNLHGAFLKDADKVGLAGDLFTFDCEELMAKLIKWNARSLLRATPPAVAAE